MFVTHVRTYLPHSNILSAVSVGFKSELQISAANLHGICTARAIHHGIAIGDTNQTNFEPEAPLQVFRAKIDEIKKEASSPP
jgi:hypothetical protein